MGTFLKTLVQVVGFSCIYKKCGYRKTIARLGNTLSIFCNHILHPGAFPTRQVMRRKLPYLQQAVEDEESQVAQCLPT